MTVYSRVTDVWLEHTLPALVPEAVTATVGLVLTVTGRLTGCEAEQPASDVRAVAVNCRLKAVQVPGFLVHVNRTLAPDATAAGAKHRDAGKHAEETAITVGMSVNPAGRQCASSSFYAHHTTHERKTLQASPSLVCMYTSLVNDNSLASCQPARLIHTPPGKSMLCTLTLTASRHISTAVGRCDVGH